MKDSWNSCFTNELLPRFYWSLKPTSHNRSWRFKNVRWTNCWSRPKSGHFCTLNRALARCKIRLGLRNCWKGRGLEYAYEYVLYELKQITVGGHSPLSWPLKIRFLSLKCTEKVQIQPLRYVVDENLAINRMC